MFVEHFLIPEANETNVYLLACAGTGHAALIDAGGFDPRVADCVRENGFRVQYILITHAHYDHVEALASYLRAFPGCEVFAGGANPGGLSARMVRDGDRIQVGKLKCAALTIPGHTEDSIAWLFERRVDSSLTSLSAPSTSLQSPASSLQPPVAGGLAPAVVFCGDVLFAGSIGGASGPAEHEREIAGIRSKLFALPDNTILYPGHGPATTVGIEKNHSPFFRL